jgi:hypothetical protein
MTTINKICVIGDSVSAYVMKRLLITLFVIFWTGTCFAADKTILVVGHSLAKYFYKSSLAPTGFIFQSIEVDGATMWNYSSDASIKYQPNITGKDKRTELSGSTADMCILILGINDVDSVSGYTGTTTQDKITTMAGVYENFIENIGFDEDNLIIFNEWPAYSSSVNPWYPTESLASYGGTLGDGTAAVQCIDGGPCLNVANTNNRYFQTLIKAWCATNGYTYIDIWQDVIDRYGATNTDLFTKLYSWDGLHLFNSLISCYYTHTGNENTFVRGGTNCPCETYCNIDEPYRWWVLPRLKAFIANKGL